MHAFGVTVNQRGSAPDSRQLPCAYSEASGKLFTDMLAAVPFRFSYAAVRDPAALEVRAQPVYLEAQNYKLVTWIIKIIAWMSLSNYKNGRRRDF